MNNKIAWIALIIAVVTAGFTLISLPNSRAFIGAAGNLLAENYIPYVMYNGGYNSAKPIKTASTLDVAGATTLTSTLNVGSGTDITELNAGTCYIRPYAATITASTTAQVDCQGTAGWDASGVSALTGVSFGDWVVSNLATTTAGATVNGIVVTGVSASTTSGYITLQISNLTGTTYTWPVTGTASGTASYISGN